MNRCDAGLDIVMVHKDIRTMGNPIVVDLSHWNPTPDWATLKANGTIGVIHKATEGTGYVDDTLFSRASAAIKAGLCWSTYHFLKGGNPTGQMAHYLKTIDPRQGERVCIDHEEKATLDELKAAVKYIRTNRPDLQVTIYSGHTIKEQLSGHDAYLAENTSLWLAQYSSTPTWPKETWPQWALWQYTDQAPAVGVSAKVDGNKWNGSEENLIKWFGPADAVPEPEPEPGPEPEPFIYRAAYEVPPGEQVNVYVNGKLVWNGVGE